MDYDALERLVGLRDSGALTEEEFQQQKQNLLQRVEAVMAPSAGGGTAAMGRFFTGGLRRGGGTSWQRHLLRLLIAVAFLTAGFVAYTKVSDWRAAQAAHQAAIDATKKSIAEQTAGATDIIKSDYENTGMTFAQLFDKIDNRIKKIEDASVSARASALEDSERESVSAYLNSLSGALRLMELKYRKSLSLSTNLEMAQSAREDYYSTPYNEYSDGWERRRVNKAVQDAQKASVELKSATSDLRDGLKGLKDIVRKNSTKLVGYSLVRADVIDKAISTNSETHGS
jgi:hypothetical protein